MSGVLQETCLGSLPFWLFINDVIDVVQTCDINLNAGDCKLLYIYDTDDDVRFLLGNELGLRWKI